MPDKHDRQGKRGGRQAEPAQSRLRVAAYVRMDPDTDDSNDTLLQRQYYAKYIKSRRDWRFAGVFVDVRYADDYKRPSLTELTEKCNSGEIDLIIVRSFARLYQDAADVMRFAQKIYAMGVDMIFQYERLQLSKLGGEGLAMLQTFASLYRDEQKAKKERTGQDE